jgi:hypothetical protein
MMPTKEYLRRKDIQTNTLFRITPDGKGVYIEDGVSYTVKEFQDKYPLPITLVSYRRNADRSRSFLEVE